MPDEDVPLCIRKIMKGFLELGPDHRAPVGALRAVSGVEDELFQRQLPVVAIARVWRQRNVFSLSIPVRDPVPRYREEPCRQVLDRLNDAVARYKLIEDILEYVLRIAFIPDPTPDEIQEGCSVPLYGGIDPRCVIHGWEICVQRYFPPFTGVDVRKYEIL